MSEQAEQFLIQIKELDREGLLNLKLEIDLAIADVEKQLLEAKARVRTTNVYSDPTWYAKASIARRFLGWKSQEIQHRLAEHLNKKQSRHLTLAEHFMEAARLLLPQEQFYLLLNEAEALMGG